MINKGLITLIALSCVTVACREHDGRFGSGETPVPDYAHGTAVEVTVLDYSPAPGQFVNTVPEYEVGDDYAAMNAKATELLNDGYMISLGAWGGSVTLKLSQPIANRADKNDFRIKGNAVYASTSVSGVRYGSAEPGIVLVMQDANANGEPDDQWYEIMGSETFNSTERYAVTYYAPAADATDNEYIRWRAQNGDSGYLNRTAAYHTQCYFPLWVENVDSLSFEGRLLPPNGYHNAQTGNYELVSYYGYADSHPNNTDFSCLDIAMAIDSMGNKVNLPSIDFIKIYTGVLQANGHLGECSTEIAGVETIE